MDDRQLVCAALGVTPLNLPETPLLARALPVRAIMEEAARLAGCPLRESVDLLTVPPEAEKENPPQESQPDGPEPSEPEASVGGIEDDPFFTAGVGQTKPVILILAALGALAIIGGIVAGITALLAWWMRRTSSPRKNGN